MSIKFSSSVLLVEDVYKSRKFYQDFLEQVVEMDHGECVVFAGGFAIWERDYALKLIFGQTRDLPGERDHAFELYFETETLDEVVDKLNNAKVELVHPMVEQPWGQRVIRVYDPDRYIVEIGEPMSATIKRYLNQGMTVDEAAARTSMPVEVVRAVRKGMA
ncbi:MAG: VOC family protein [Candidatus Saccharibacteria bacterium]